jgi:hypothetical protein
LRPPPRTTARVFVACVPWRAAASWPTTTWWISGTLVCTSKISAGRSTVSVLVAMRVTPGPFAPSARGRRAAGAGDGTLDEQQALLGVHGVDGEVLGGLAHAAHAAGHAHALEDAAGGGAGTDRAGLAVVAVRTVGGRDAGLKP